MRLSVLYIFSSKAVAYRYRNPAMVDTQNILQQKILYSTSFGRVHTEDMYSRDYR